MHAVITERLLRGFQWNRSAMTGVVPAARRQFLRTNTSAVSERLANVVILAYPPRPTVRRICDHQSPPSPPLMHLPQGMSVAPSVGVEGTRMSEPIFTQVCLDPGPSSLASSTRAISGAFTALRPRCLANRCSPDI